MVDTKRVTPKSWMIQKIDGTGKLVWWEGVSPDGLMSMIGSSPSDVLDMINDREAIEPTDADSVFISL